MGKPENKTLLWGRQHILEDENKVIFRGTECGNQEGIDLCQGVIASVCERGDESSDSIVSC
jgi:hypothetical protein